MTRRADFRGNLRGVTRTEVVVSVVCLAIAAVVLLAWASKVSRRNDMARCKPNLKQVGLALMLWLDDNNETSLQAFFQNARSNGDRRRDECWFYMMSLSNQLISPQLLVCPADKRANCENVGHKPGSGLGAANYQDRACSYGVALDGFMSGSGWVRLEACINSVLFLDRHLGGKATPDQCRSTQIASTGFQKPFDLWWKPDLHGPSEGNVSFQDGSVQTASESMVESAFPIDLRSQNRAHVLFPKRQ